jgi:predicted alpha/beta superfamily hydrolase
MHEGQNLFDGSMAFGGVEWEVDETLDAAAESGAVREAIVVGVGNTSDRLYEYTPTYDASEGFGGDADKYLALLVGELKPRIDQDFRTFPARESTAVIGSSLGGLVSAYAGVREPDVFGLVGAMSPSTWWDSGYIVGEVAKTPAAPGRPLRVYVDSGNAGNSQDDMANTALLAGAYADLGYSEGSTLHYVVQDGATHSEAYWAQRLPGALAFLLGPRDPLPGGRTMSHHPVPPPSHGITLVTLPSSAGVRLAVNSGHR